MAMQLWNGVNVFKEEMVMESVLSLGGTKLWNIVPRRYYFDEKDKGVVFKKFCKESFLLLFIFDKTL